MLKYNNHQLPLTLKNSKALTPCTLDVLDPRYKPNQTYTPKCHTSRMLRSLKCRGVKIWNEISVKVTISGFAAFKKTF